MIPLLCTQCNASITPEDAAYDDRMHNYFCDEPCFHDWADENYEEVAEFYVRMNLLL